MSAQWKAVRDGRDKRKVSYWVLTADPSKRTAAVGSIHQDKTGAEHILGWFRARTYTWERGERQGAPGGEVLGWFPTKRAAMRAVETAAEHEVGKVGARRTTEAFFRA